MKMRPSDRRLFDPWIGETLRGFKADEGDDSIHFYFGTAAPLLKLSHHQDCCENVRVVYIDEDFADLRGEVIIAIHSFVYADEYPPGWNAERLMEYTKHQYVPDESWTFTVMVFESEKRRRQMFWLGESNGYYNENVDVDDHPTLPRYHATVGTQ